MAVPGLSWSERALSLVQKMNNFYSPGSSRYQCRPFIVGGKEVGKIPPAVLKELHQFPDIFFFSKAENGAVELNYQLVSYQERSSAMEGVLQKIRAKHKFLCLEGWRDEKYDVKPNFYDQPLMCMERAATSLFGVKRYGVHVNGFTRPGDGQLAMWLGQRSFTKQTYPGLLDNMAAGGIPAQSGIKETLIRECAEEASIPMATAATAVPVSAVSYTHENELGIFPECQFVFDLEVPKEFEPTNADGEMQKFYLWPINKVKEAIVSTDFKPNCAMVALDFLIRHSYLSPDSAPRYLAHQKRGFGATSTKATSSEATPNEGETKKGTCALTGAREEYSLHVVPVKVKLKKSERYLI
uniref:Nudix hydrolase 20, chloroplastic-like n=1 Tax=Erpetoichthys calabaricus TaxID=27687 RepID=A0A8C4XCU8_ERPCA